MAKMDRKLMREKTHGIFDYVVSFLLIVLPYYVVPAEPVYKWLAISSGILLFLYASSTSFYAGLWERVRFVPLKAHLITDGLIGAVLVSIGYLSSEPVFSYLMYVIGLSLLAVAFVMRRH